MNHQYYHYNKRNSNDKLPYKEWSQLFPDLNLIDGNFNVMLKGYNHHGTITNSNVNTNVNDDDNGNSSNNDSKGQEQVQHISLRDIQCNDCNKEFITSELSQIIKIRNILKESIENDLLMNIKE